MSSKRRRTRHKTPPKLAYPSFASALVLRPTLPSRRTVVGTLIFASGASGVALALVGAGSFADPKGLGAHVRLWALLVAWQCVVMLLCWTRRWAREATGFWATAVRRVVSHRAVLLTALVLGLVGEFFELNDGGGSRLQAISSGALFAIIVFWWTRAALAIARAGVVYAWSITDPVAHRWFRAAPFMIATGVVVSSYGDWALIPGAVLLSAGLDLLLLATARYPGRLKESTASPFRKLGLVAVPVVISLVTFAVGQLP